MLAAERQLVTLGALALGALLVFPKLAGWLARQGIGAAGSVIRETATGAVIGIGEVVGIPPTDAAKCDQYVAAGDWWNASFYCPAGTFLKSASGAVYDTATGAVVGTSAPSAHAEIIAIKPAPELPGVAPGVDVNLSDIAAP